MPRLNLAGSSSARLLSFLLVAAMLVSVIKVSTIAFAATQFTWTGTNPPANLSSPNNWLGNVAPSAGDDLFFPSGVRRKSIKNTYLNLTSFNSLNFSGSGYNLKKNSLTLTGGINATNPTGTNQISLPIHLNGAQTFTSANGGTSLTLSAQVNLNSNLLTIAGAGNTTANGVVSGSGGGITKNGSGTLTLTGNNTYTGATTVTAGTLLVNGSQSNSNVSLTGGILGGTGVVGTISATGGAVRPGASIPGILNSGNVTLASTSSFVVDLNGTIPGAGYRQLNVSGTVSLGNSVLDASANFQSAVGDTFTIINNNGGDSIVGTFMGLPEGATLTLGGLPFDISYQGGTGNDVVLTRVISPAPPPPAISIDDVSLAEGNSGTTDMVFTLSLTASSSQTVRVDYSTDDQTTTPDDYVSTFGTLAFDPGETTKTIAVPINGDTLNEIDETFALNLRNSTNASISDAQAQGTILNNDALPALTIEDVSVTEGNTGTVEAVFSVSLSTPSGQTVTVNYATANGTATDHPGNDYDAVSGTLTFAPGETDDEVIVSVTGDTSVEPDETFFVNLTGQTNSTLSDSQGLGTILDDDAVPTPTP
ncbi:MAG TPA: Calx-beta domain-containing protein, partial [Pyrinomonadaceae bacterium]|nr:Calx-beta domain-containing protein [Pyrinomonadaceae bacterium]